MVKAFVSSAGLDDLSEYRDSIETAIWRAGVDQIAVEQILPVDYSNYNTARQTIESVDLTVFLIGYRYGMVDSASDKGIIEIEYELAKEIGKPIIIFMAGPDTPLRRTDIDTDSNRIDKFREKLITERNVGFFNTPDELHSLALRTLSSFLTKLKDQNSNQPEKSAEQIKKKDVRILRCLLSSPGDVQEERKRFSNAIFRYNQFAVDEYSIFIKLVKWEDMAPQIGPKAQDVINKQIGTYDLFSGIMWNRFGTPTEIASSGTEEEFNVAFSFWEKQRIPWMTFYFCERPANFTTTEQLEQKQKVLDFRIKLEHQGIVRSYDSIDVFEELVYKDLIRITTLPEFRELMEHDTT